MRERERLVLWSAASGSRRWRLRIARRTRRFSPHRAIASTARQWRALAAAGGRSRRAASRETASAMRCARFAPRSPGWWPCALSGRQSVGGHHGSERREARAPPAGRACVAARSLDPHARDAGRAQRASEAERAALARGARVAAGDGRWRAAHRRGGRRDARTGTIVGWTSIR